jgi:hypothetical protein
MIESEISHPPVIVHWGVEVGQSNERLVTILSVEVHLHFNNNSSSVRGQLQQNCVKVAVGDTREYCPCRITASSATSISRKQSLMQKNVVFS